LDKKDYVKLLNLFGSVFRIVTPDMDSESGPDSPWRGSLRCPNCAFHFSNVS